MNRLYSAIGISKQAVHGYLERSLRIKNEELELIKYIHEIRADHPTMGARDMYFMIRPECMGRDRFERFCKDYGFRSKKPKNYMRTTDSSGVERFPNLIETLEISRMDQVWQSDITYYDLNGKFYYITFIIDSYTRRIVGHEISNRLLTTSTTLPALQKAIKTRRGKDLEGLIFHSDGGGQYYAGDFLKLTKDKGIVNSMCEYAWENGKAERINGVIKNNYLKHRNIRTFSELVKEVDRAVHLYNHDKPHCKLGRKSPITFEKELLYLSPQTRPRMSNSFEANIQI